jgi:glutathione peroxidase
MRATVRLLAALLLFAPAAACAEDKGGDKVTSPLDFKMKGLDGKEVDLARFKGKAVLIVNVASQCGYTPQYKGLQALYEKHGKDGLVVVGVPANEFGAQEPGSDAEIAKFCKSNYDVNFPMLSKVVVKGPGITPLYRYLTSKDTNPKFAGEIKWNFTKFLVARDGLVVGRYEPKVEPEAIARDIEAELKKQP